MSSLSARSGNDKEGADNDGLRPDHFSSRTATERRDDSSEDPKQQQDYGGE